MGHARALISVQDPEVQLALYEQILQDGLSVRQVEDWYVMLPMLLLLKHRRPKNPGKSYSRKNIRC